MRTKIPTGNEDVNFFRCVRCGFPCDLKRDRIGQGTGITYTVQSRGTGVTGPDDPVVRSGCPQCGKRSYTTK